MSSDMNLNPESFSGQGSSDGGSGPDPPLDGYPLLVFADGAVRTEDGKATVEEVVAAYDDTKDVTATAKRLGTTTDHVQEALEYAAEANVAREEE